MLWVPYFIYSFAYLKVKPKNEAIIPALLPIVLFLLSGIMLRHYTLIAASITFGTAHLYVAIENKK